MNTVALKALAAVPYCLAMQELLKEAVWALMDSGTAQFAIYPALA